MRHASPHPRPGGVRRLLARAATALLVGAAALVAPPSTAHAASTPVNTGFEADGTGTATPSGWSTYSAGGHAGASFTEAGGRSGSYRLTHWASRAYAVETYQYLDGLTNGSHTLTAWVRSSGGQNAAYLALRNCGSAEQRTDLPPTPNGAWVRLVTSVRVTSNQCTISIVSDANAGNWINVDDISFTPGATGLAITGGDVSSLKKSEDLGGVYRYAGGAAGDALTILNSAGMNYARLKVWVDPADGYNNKTQVLAMAKRIKALGMGLLVDFHYSDRWADPGQQTKPAAWSGYTAGQLSTAVYNHTHDVLNALKAQGTTADMVQVGNEINGGMLWPEGSTANWGNLAAMLTSGANAVKAVNPSTRVALHLAEGGDYEGARTFFDQATSRGVPFDAIGVSYYGYWHGALNDLQTTLDGLAARYGKPVFVAETAYAFTLANDDSLGNIVGTSDQLVPGYPATQAGQAANLRDVMNVVEAVPNGRGLGVFYWEPTWTAVTGNGWDPADPSSGNAWENQALFGYNDRATAAMAWFDHR
ncbi:glycoside hydrolase family 53 protein [Allostreptomyces psammosilenae]|uniref:Arabinogalactan endo-beta-1,4-galactanase n=1 Tax=Allostreptomyces psammosilenae TaxID=1892865 RepID=A0A853A0E1_9ACTN|nr:arabinogalactan endo-1,4-beta-galactosidase [Allostreptomyces psammosilenae]NYI07587.1 arabinogalactan endo-1,4-beta-galactosidase [Allostreptomyces psammosilenae]